MLRPLLLAVLLALLAAAPAWAAHDMDVGIADDAVLLAGGTQADAAVADWRALGVDSVRILVRWSAIAPSPQSPTMPAGFDPRRQSDPLYGWGAVDGAVARLRAAGIRPILAITGSGPLWGSQDPGAGNPRSKPDPDDFADFAFAAAARYRDDATQYIVWNEPNQPTWLQPQFTCTGRRCTPYAPILYRALLAKGAASIRRADPGAQVLAGALAPSGQSPVTRNAVMRPLQFLRALACVTKSGARDGCSGAHAIRVDGFAYHPHPVRFTPRTHAPNPDNASIADLGRVERALDRATAHGLLRTPRGAKMPLWLTEFGYQTNPPDRDAGVSPAHQAAWLQESWRIAWSDPRVRNVTQYEWRDEPLKAVGVSGFGSWQSGLEFEDGRAKPALAAFRCPVDLRGGVLWGQVRPGGAASVEVERSRGNGWASYRALSTDAHGGFTLHVPAGGRWRYVAAGTCTSAATP